MGAAPAASVDTGGEVGEGGSQTPGGSTMRGTAWTSVGLVGLLVAGCASPTPLPVNPTIAPTPTDEPTVARTATPTATLRAEPQESQTQTVAPTRTPTRPAPTIERTEAAGGITITVLYDNNATDDRLETAWGFSCLVEGPEETILFDTGGDSALLLRNAQTLGIALEDVDLVVISHVHRDHVGGLQGFLAASHDVTVVLPQSFPESIKTAVTAAGAGLVEVDDPVEICAHAYSTGELGGGIKEQSLVMETSKGLVVITGCAHPGVVDIVRRAKELTNGEVYLVVGGFHLNGASEARIAGIIEDFRDMGVQKVAPCHCSGDVARRLFEQAYGEDFILLGVGGILEMET
jgi:7,8-dihydropterin-6-yl-methyl-4-(beta-D-ribofuranosyl)aminobenzene 5'-phosphate synthase